MRLGITEYIDCAHFLPGHPKCGTVHGHTYRVDVVIEGDHKGGMILDFPTVENICELLSRQLRERIKFPLVTRVWEGNGKWAEM